MIDFIRGNLIHTDSSLLKQHPLLEFKGDINHQTGEIDMNNLVAKYKSMTFKIHTTATNEYINVSGSLHKLFTWNSSFQKGENWSDFSYSNLLESLNEIENVFKISTNHLVLQNIEYGVNVSVPFDMRDFFSRLVNYKGEELNRMHNHRGSKNSIGYRLNKQRYSIKLYNKSDQYDTNDNSLRWEIHSTRMKDLNDMGLFSCNDLKNKTKLSLLRKDLLVKFDQLFIYEDVTLDHLSNFDKRLCEMAKHPTYWTELKKQQRKTHDFQRRKYFELISRYSKSFFKETVRDLISEKFQFLLTN